MQERLLRWANQRGYRVAWGPATVATEARRDILERRARAEFDEGFFHEELEPMTADPAPAAGSTLVAVAKPVPAYHVRFRRQGGVVEALIPPTYVRYRATFEEVRRDLQQNGLPGARVEHFGWPLKAVAARLGLVRYGRNNVGYVNGLGSYVQLCAFVTDAALPSTADEDNRGPALLEQCAGCNACAGVCPTGAISDDRVLLHGERCLTHINEKPGAWPSWLPASSHNCVLGCLLCQQICPANVDLRVEDSGLEFSEPETRTLLGEGGPADGRAETGIRFKLAWLGQPYSEPVLGRNLRALLDGGALAR